MENIINIADVMLCPDCNKCGRNFRLYTEFKYSVTKAYTR